MLMAAACVICIILISQFSEKLLARAMPDRMGEDDPQTCARRTALCSQRRESRRA